LSDFPVGSEDFLGQGQIRDLENNGSDSESHVSFDSERPSVDSDDGAVDEITALDFVVQKLYEQLVYVFYGRTDEEHSEDRRRHLVDAGDSHHNLSEMFNDDTFPSVLGFQGCAIGYHLQPEYLD
jgi:hypothetical protein